MKTDDIKSLDKCSNDTQLEPRIVKYIDLCSGIGGFRVAINNLFNTNVIFKCILSADIKQDAIDTYNINFGEENEKNDIYNLQPDEINKFDLLCAGFPCQPFSSAGQKKGFSDERGGMIFKIIEICKHHKPENIILENVYNLITLNKGECILKIKDLFEELGYFVSYGKFNSSDFGCPQSRNRVYIICNLNKKITFTNIKYSKKVYLKNIIDTTITSSDINPIFVDKLLKMHNIKPIYGCKIGDKRGGVNNIHSWDISYNGHVSNDECQLMNKIMLERRKKHWADTKKIKWMDGMPLTYNEILTFYKNDNLQKMLDNLIKYKYLKLEKCKDIVNGKRVYKNDSEEGYNICKGKLSFPISMILDPNYLSPTLTATDSHKLAVIVNDSIIRSLTKNEIKKICGFPNTFIIPDHVNYYDLFGNMATPPVIVELLKQIYI
jgi:DNA (cytosine-5)-methyltransferase 1